MFIATDAWFDNEPRRSEMFYSPVGMFRCFAPTELDELFLSPGSINIASLTGLNCQ